MDANSSFKGAPTLKAPEREGWLFKRGQVHTSWKKRWFVLKHGELSYFKFPKDKRSKGIIRLEGASVTIGSSEKLKRKFGFEISSTTYARVYTIHAPDHNTMMEWVTSIREAIQFLGDSEKGTSTALGETTGLISPGRAPRNLYLFDENVTLDLTPDPTLRTRAGVHRDLSTWRTSNAFKGRTNAYGKHLKSICTLQLSAPKGEESLPFVSCMAVRNDGTEDVVAVGRNSWNSDEGIAVDIFRQLSATDPKLQMVARLGRPSRGDGATVSNDVDWNEDNLLVASQEGAVYLYNKVPADPPSGGWGKAIGAVSTFAHPDSVSIPVQPPGKWLNSNRIARARWTGGNSASQFVSLTYGAINLWDVNRDKPLSNNLYSEWGTVLSALAVNPNPGYETQFAVGGRFSLNILDTRYEFTSSSTSSVFGVGGKTKGGWVVRDAHQELIRDVKFSPLVPYWLASASDDGTCKIWDYRYGKSAVCVLSAQTNGATSLDWSRSHVDMLLTGGLDRSVRLWQLNTPPHYTIGAVQLPTVPASVSFSRANPFNFYECTGNGKVGMYGIEAELVKKLVVVKHLVATATIGGNAILPSNPSGPMPGELTINLSGHPPPPQPQQSTAIDPAEQDIQELLYLRDFSAAFTRIARLADRLWRLGHLDQATALLKLTTSEAVFSKVLDSAVPGWPMSPPAVLDPPPAEAGQPKLSWAKLAASLAQHAPSSPLALVLSRVDMNSPEAAQIQYLKLRVTLLKLIEADKYVEILALLTEICTQINRNGDSFDALTLRKLVGAILPHDWFKGLDFALNVGQTLKNSGDFSCFAGVARLIMSPTIYGVERDAGTDDGHASDESDSDDESRGSGSSKNKSRDNSVRGGSAMSGRSTGGTSTTGSATGAVGSPGGVMLSREGQWKSARRNLENSFRNPKMALSQLELMIAMHLAIAQFSMPEEKPAWQEFYNEFAALNTSPTASENLAEGLEKNANWLVERLTTDSARAVIRNMDEPKTGGKVFPAVLHVLYFCALIQQKLFDKMFIMCTKLAASLVGYPFAAVLESVLIGKLAIPRFETFLSRCAVRDTAKPWVITKPLGAALVMANILFNVQTLPPALETLIQQNFSQVTSIIQSGLREMSRNPGYVPQSGSSAPRDAAEKADQTLKQIGRLKVQQLRETPYLAHLIKELETILTGFINIK